MHEHHPLPPYAVLHISPQIVYYSFKLIQLHMLAEVTFPAGGSASAPRLCTRSEAPPYAPLALQLLEAALRQ